MIIDDTGIIINIRKFGENSLIVSCFLAQHGLLNGFYRLAKQKKSSGSEIIIGNIMRVRWWARLEEQLGTYQLETEDNIIGKVAFNKYDLAIINATTQLLHLVLNEKEAQPQLFAYTVNLLQSLYQDDVTIVQKIYNYICFELQLLQQTGFGIDLSKCAVTATQENLKYLSPRTGRAVCAEVGAPYAEKLFILPNLLLNNTMPNSRDELLSALNITGYFLEKAIANGQYRNGSNNARQQVVQILYANAINSDLGEQRRAHILNM